MLLIFRYSCAMIFYLRRYDYDMPLRVTMLTLYRRHFAAAAMTAPRCWRYGVGAHFSPLLLLLLLAALRFSALHKAHTLFREAIEFSQPFHVMIRCCCRLCA